MPVIPILGILCCLFIVYKGIPKETFIAFSVWIALGLLIYFAYSYKNANLDLDEQAELITEENKEQLEEVSK